MRIICAEDVLALDRLTGKSDPVAFIFCGTESKLSCIKMGTINPYWNEEFRFGGVSQDIKHVDELFIQIKDDDGVSHEATSIRGRTESSSSSGGNRSTRKKEMKRLYDNLGGVRHFKPIIPDIIIYF